MFQDTYKSAYHKIAFQGEVSEAQVAEWIGSFDKRNHYKIELLQDKNTKKKAMPAVRKTRRILPTMAAMMLIVCLSVVLGAPVAAENIPAFYGVLERKAPGLLDYLIPIQETDTDRGIVLTLEAAYVEGNRAEILVSFTDDGNGDYIHGMVDMYDSYNLQSYGEDSNVGGCAFMEYDAEQDKAYFQIDLMSTDGSFDTDRMEFSVHQLLTDCESFQEEIRLNDMVQSVEVKSVSLNGRSGMEQMHPALDKLTVPGNEVDPRPGHSVMDIPLDNISPDEMKITGIAYMDGILRIQLCRGNFREADRHMNIYMLDEAGNQIHPNLAVGWQEDVANEKILMEEYYFVITEEQLETYTIWGEGEVRDGSIKGDWNITFDLN